MSRILLAVLLMVEVLHVVDELVQTVDPLFRFLWCDCYQVKIFLVALEDDGEALLLHTGISVFIKALRLTAHAHRINVVNGDCLKRGHVQEC